MIDGTREFAVLVVLAESFLPQLTLSQSRADSLRYARAQINSLSFPRTKLARFSTRFDAHCGMPSLPIVAWDPAIVTLDRVSTPSTFPHIEARYWVVCGGHPHCKYWVVNDH